MDSSMNPMCTPSTTRCVSPAFTPPQSPRRPTDEEDVDLYTLLLRSAELTVKIRRAYHRLKESSDAKFFTYVLLLQNGYVYVGNSDNIFVRLMDHLLQSPQSSMWVREHGPVVQVMEVILHSSKDDEMYKMLEWCDLVGYHKVRGATYCKVDARGPPPQLCDFVRDPTRHFKYASRSWIDEMVRYAKILAGELDT
jgi:predicted GIY-YIG superfamily endonuclease